MHINNTLYIRRKKKGDKKKKTKKKINKKFATTASRIGNMGTLVNISNAIMFLLQETSGIYDFNKSPILFMDNNIITTTYIENRIVIILSIISYTMV